MRYTCIACRSSSTDTRKPFMFHCHNCKNFTMIPIGVQKAIFNYIEIRDLKKDWE